MSTEIDRNPGKKKWRGYAINALLLVVMVAGIRAWQQRDMVGGAAPALHGTTLTEVPYALPAHPAQPMLVHFWGSWCAICRAEQNSIAELARDHANVISIAMRSGGKDEVISYMRQQGVAFPVLNDPDESIARAWGVNAVPASFIIGTDGKIRFIEVGYTSSIGLRLRLWLVGMPAKM